VLEAHLLDLAYDLAVPLDELVGRHGRVDLHCRVIEQHLALEEDPARTLPGFAVGHSIEERAEFGSERAEHLLAVVEWDRSDQVQAAGAIHHVTFSSFCSERRYFGTGTPGWVLGQLV
jgi:hypothetical protein